MIQKMPRINNPIPVAISIIVSILIGIFIAKQYLNKKSEVITIGILQTISHPALDRAREGFVNQITKKLPDQNIEYIVQNGEGSVAQLHSMAKSMHSKVDAIYAIGTPAAQAAATVEKKKPIIIAAVTDPDAAGFVYSGTNVCGTSDMIDIPHQIKMLQALVPLAKTVAIIYNPGEVNSVSQVTKMEEELTKQQIAVIKVGVGSESELQTAMLSATKKADVILAPTDNLIVGAIPTIAALAVKAKIPLIASDNPSVERGALASAGIDYYIAGEESANTYIDIILNHKKPADIPIQTPKDLKVIINKNTLNGLGLTVPESLKHNVKLVP